ncbi:N-acetylglucosamine-1-phosphotransferase subunits alpha/beta-like [Diadema setosum]|uniref:N-acetylglucosamine-1-phosphotransferase subunits alpha/beta-like n=1 Tax=Diadema setosum TaxID=31175 RepID=UPI003B3A760E
MKMFKIVQKQTYTFLSHRYGMLLIFSGIILVIVSAFQFGEVAIEWSQDRYSRLFNIYHDNIANKAFENRMCLPIPIDAVYTWVNGSDIKLLKDLEQAKRELESSVTNTTDNSESSFQCRLKDCMPAALLVTSPALDRSVTVSQLGAVESSLLPITAISNITREGGQTNTILQFQKQDDVEAVVKKTQSFTLSNKNYTLSKGYITSDFAVTGSVAFSDRVLITGVGKDTTEEEVKFRLADQYQKDVGEVVVENVAGLAVVFITNPEVINDVISEAEKTNTTSVLKVNKAYLMWNLEHEEAKPDEDYAPNRFEDNEELRYSLRSLERHAPWIRRVYIVTNGQIPSWLNLDNPRLVLVSHDEIFQNKTHLPTFSSPAIESHIHRIPGLSRKFVYLNDDTMFGKDIWPDDFYTHASGQKVYLTWPVPNCAEGCPSSWIKDNYCDKACNNSECEWDGGDCEGVQAQGGMGIGLHGGSTNLDQMYCNTGCANGWIADKYCDQACNVPECGFDAGDCGKGNFHRVHSTLVSEDRMHITLPKGLEVTYFNVTPIFGQGSTITEGKYDNKEIVRTATIAQKFKTVHLLLYKNMSESTLTFHILGKGPNDTLLNVTFNVTVDTRENKGLDLKLLNLGNETSEKETEVKEEDSEFPFNFDDISEERQAPKVSRVRDKEVGVSYEPKEEELTEEVAKQLEELKQQLEDGDLTQKGHDRLRSQILAHYMLSPEYTKRRREVALGLHARGDQQPLQNAKQQFKETDFVGQIPAGGLPGQGQDQFRQPQVVVDNQLQQQKMWPNVQGYQGQGQANGQGLGQGGNFMGQGQNQGLMLGNQGQEQVVNQQGQLGRNNLPGQEPQQQFRPYQVPVNQQPDFGQQLGQQPRQQPVGQVHVDVGMPLEGGQQLKQVAPGQAGQVPHIQEQFGQVPAKNLPVEQVQGGLMGRQDAGMGQQQFQPRQEFEQVEKLPQVNIVGQNGVNVGLNPPQPGRLNGEQTNVAANGFKHEADVFDDLMFGINVPPAGQGQRDALHLQPQGMAEVKTGPKPADDETFNAGLGPDKNQAGPQQNLAAPVQIEPMEDFQQRIAENMQQPKEGGQLGEAPVLQNQFKSNQNQGKGMDQFALNNQKVRDTKEKYKNLADKFENHRENLLTKKKKKYNDGGAGEDDLVARQRHDNQDTFDQPLGVENKIGKVNQQPVQDAVPLAGIGQNLQQVDTQNKPIKTQEELSKPIQAGLDVNQPMRNDRVDQPAVQVKNGFEDQPGGGNGNDIDDNNIGNLLKEQNNLPFQLPDAAEVDFEDANEGERGLQGANDEEKLKQGDQGFRKLLSVNKMTKEAAKVTTDNERSQGKQYIAQLLNDAKSIFRDPAFQSEWPKQIDMRISPGYLVHELQKKLTETMSHSDNFESVKHEKKKWSKSTGKPSPNITAQPVDETEAQQSKDEQDRKSSFLPWERSDSFKNLTQILEHQDVMQQFSVQSGSRRHLLDTFGDSLRHVNKLFNKKFGYQARKVPAHMPHMIDVGIMNDLQAEFAEEYDITSSHRLRHPRDMQYAFSYFYYLMGTPKIVNVTEVFDEFDTDDSGVLSDREIRTLATRLYDLPLDLKTLTSLEKLIITCAENITEKLTQPADSAIEKYYEEKMPQVTKDLLMHCPPLIDKMQGSVKGQTMYKYELMGEDEIAFKMIQTNVSKVIGQLDDIRKHPKKFVCLNDNIDHTSKDAYMVKAVLQDFYESLFPIPSQFELPREYRNRFLHIDELREWRRYRDWLRFWTHLSLGALITFSIISFCSSHLLALKRRCFGRRRWRGSGVAETVQHV